MDLLIVGAGLSGAVIAERCSKVPRELHLIAQALAFRPPDLAHMELAGAWHDILNH